MKWALMLLLGTNILIDGLRDEEDDGFPTTLSMPICSLSTNLAPVMVHSNT
jgi:hypothetical protein